MIQNLLNRFKDWKDQKIINQFSLQIFVSVLIFVSLILSLEFFFKQNRQFVMNEYAEISLLRETFDNMSLEERKFRAEVNEGHEDFFRDRSSSELDAFRSRSRLFDNLISMHAHHHEISDINESFIMFWFNRYSNDFNNLTDIKNLKLRYVELLEKFADSTYQVGFKDFGLEGKWRSFAHRLEEKIDKKNRNRNEYKIQYLQMRRAEKDFLLRKEKGYLKQLNDNIDQLANSLNHDSESLALLLSYREVFNSYIPLTIEKQKLTEELRTTSFELQEKLDFKANILYEIMSNIINLQLKLGLVVFGLSLIFSVLLLLRNIKTVIAPLYKLTDFLPSIGSGSAKHISLNRKDEFQVVEKEINIMVDKIQSQIAQAKMASLGEMAGGIAHEINNPIAIMQGKANQLIKQINNGSWNNEIGKEQLEKIVNETHRVAKIVRGLRTFSRNADSDPFLTSSVRDIVSDVLGLCEARFKNHAIDLKIGQIPDIHIECRSTQIAQVLSNLVNNAFDAVTSLPEKWVELEVEHCGEMVRVSVIDSGKGIPSHVADKLMQPFFTTKEVGKGTGLGLSISKGIVEDHGGKFWLDRNSVNTRFVIEMPIKQSVRNALSA